jgi:hypothetical protein
MSFLTTPHDIQSFLTGRTPTRRVRRDSESGLPYIDLFSDALDDIPEEELIDQNLYVNDRYTQLMIRYGYLHTLDEWRKRRGEIRDEDIKFDFQNHFSFQNNTHQFVLNIQTPTCILMLKTENKFCLPTFSIQNSDETTTIEEYLSYFFQELGLSSQEYFTNYYIKQVTSTKTIRNGGHSIKNHTHYLNFTIPDEIRYENSIGVFIPIIEIEKEFDIRYYKRTGNRQPYRKTKSTMKFPTSSYCETLIKIFNYFNPSNRIISSTISQCYQTSCL